ncbi:hypothetical protein P3T24_004370 [Paraburkholderia sp. GAS33]|uniref:hypothetical protein n=1 Tax=Paraburkholderia sp. GAS33 TaxID=3035130 RepID=UPI003D193239
MDIDELTGAELDFWVAKAEGMDAELKSLYGQSYCRVDINPTGFIIYEPTQNSKVAAEIAFRQCYTLYPHPCLDQQGHTQKLWLAEAQWNKRFHGTFVDASPHVAICRLRVAEAIAEKQIVKNF